MDRLRGDNMAIVQLISSDMTWDGMLKLNSQESLVFLCQRLRIEEEWQASYMEPAAFLQQFFMEDPDKIIMLLSQGDVELLFSIWDAKDSFELSYMDRRNIVPLEKVGFLQYDPRKKILLVNEEAKHNFYFYLKSRSSVRAIHEYQRLEYAIKGILYQCGIMEFTQLCDILLEGGIEKSKEEIHGFLVGRMEFFDFLGILKNTKTQAFYLESCEVKNRERIFEGWIQEERPFHKISMEEAIFSGKMNGIGIFKGSKEMMAFCLTKIFDDVIPATVFVKTILIYIQNGDPLEQLQEKLKSKISDFSEEEKNIFQEYLAQMYLYTPLFHLKGYSRWEVEQENLRFSVIQGGRND